eukprot:3129068-Ditylum_brightwellii.AAC.1
MQSSAKHIQWQDGVQNHQNGGPLLVLDPHVNGYKFIELYQWEMCMQFHSRGSSNKVPTMDIGDKIKSFIVKLQEAHGKDKFSVFTEDEKIVKLKLFPKKMVEIKSMFKYSVNDRWWNISLAMHMMSTKSFSTFKNRILTWLKMNKYYMNKTIFKSSKDM